VVWVGSKHSSGGISLSFSFYYSMTVRNDSLIHLDTSPIRWNQGTVFCRRNIIRYRTCSFKGERLKLRIWMIACDDEDSNDAAIWRWGINRFMITSAGLFVYILKIVQQRRPVSGFTCNPMIINVFKVHLIVGSTSRDGFSCFCFRGIFAKYAIISY